MNFQRFPIPNSVRMLKRRLLRRVEGEKALRLQFARCHGGALDVNNARTFTEKLYRMMIDINRTGCPMMTRLADKYLARQHVADTVGKQYLIPMLWSGEDPSDIPFDVLPSKTIAMTNHGSGQNVILQEGIDRAEIISTLRGWLSENYYWVSRSYYYYDIEPRVMINELIDDGHQNGPLDYRIWCFHGKPEAIQVDNHTHNLNAFYTPSWQLTDATYRSTSGIRKATRPDNLGKMLSIAAKLSEPFDFVRIDLYNVHGKIYFGEFTFAPTAGQNKFSPQHWDLYFGERW